jgi:hypothetical protein
MPSLLTRKAVEARSQDEKDAMETVFKDDEFRRELMMEGSSFGIRKKWCSVHSGSKLRRERAIPIRRGCLFEATTCMMHPL